MTTRELVGSIAFSVMPVDEAIEVVLNEANSVGNTNQDEGVAIHFCNAYNVALARSDHEYRNLIARGDYVFSDGVPITWVGKRAVPNKAHDWERVYGPDVMEGVFAGSTPTSPHHYLLGSSPAVLAALQQRLLERFPDAQIVGSESPPYRPATQEELAERDRRIRATGATIVWVGLGTPKQDVEVARLAATLPVVAVAVGAAFDFLAGTKPQAPVWMQKSGTEWLFRFASEPRRLARRYIWGNSVFLVEAVRTLRQERRPTNRI